MGDKPLRAEQAAFFATHRQEEHRAPESAARGGFGDRQESRRARRVVVGAVADGVAVYGAAHTDVVEMGNDDDVLVRESRIDARHDADNVRRARARAADGIALDEGAAPAGRQKPRVAEYRLDVRRGLLDLGARRRAAAHRVVGEGTDAGRHDGGSDALDLRAQRRRREQRAETNEGGARGQAVGVHTGKVV